MIDYYLVAVSSLQAAHSSGHLLLGAVRTVTQELLRHTVAETGL